MKNVTLSLDDETYRRARIRAAEQNTSVSGLVKALLTVEVDGGLPDAPGAEWLALAAELRGLSNGRTGTPAELLQREGRDER